jgi:hypothetical protein
VLHLEESAFRVKVRHSKVSATDIDGQEGYQ